MSSPSAFFATTPVRVTSGHVTLSARAFGRSGAPTILFVHGYPDTSALWSAVADRLAGRFRIVTYDVRGAGASDRPRETADYRLARLTEDVHAVLDALAPNSQVHLVGHDWGSVQGWEFVTSERADRFRSFTSISGPCLDHASWLLRDVVGTGRNHRVEGPRHARARIALGQLIRSWYIAVLSRPAVAAAFWRGGGARRFVSELERIEGIAPSSTHPAPTLLEDAIHGANLYAANVARRLRLPRPDPFARLPVQIVIPERDRFISPAIVEAARPFVRDLRVSRLDAHHWCPVARPDAIANLVERFVDDVESRGRDASASTPS